MELLNIKEYVAREKDLMRRTTNKRRIKLGIIDATAPGDAANHLYIKNKVKDFAEMGWGCQVYSVDTDSIKETIDYAINDDCTSVIVQLPTREGIHFDPEMIPPAYDCDGLNPNAVVWPATPAGIVCYLDRCGFPFSGSTAVILGRSNIVGKPLAELLTYEDMTVTLCHSKSREEDVKALVKNADLIVCAVGKPHTLKREDCPNAIVIDVGINRDENGKLCGDFDEDLSITPRMSTPVPGGVGLLTRLALMQNCWQLGAFPDEFNDQMVIKGF